MMTLELIPIVFGQEAESSGSGFPYGLPSVLTSLSVPAEKQTDGTSPEGVQGWFWSRTELYLGSFESSITKTRCYSLASQFRCFQVSLCEKLRSGLMEDQASQPHAAHLSCSSPRVESGSSSACQDSVRDPRATRTLK